MLNAIIHAALTHRWITLAIALAVLGIGGWSLVTLPIDVFPDLNRPRVTVITEAHGLAPEEVEAQVTFPIEAALNGSPGVLAVRSSSAMGVSIVHAEFDWSTNLYVDRQIVAEKLGSLSGTLPEGMTPMLAPISSVIGQILMVGLWSESGETSAADCPSATAQATAGRHRPATAHPAIGAAMNRGATSHGSHTAAMPFARDCGEFSSMIRQIPAAGRGINPNRVAEAGIEPARRSLSPGF